MWESRFENKGSINRFKLFVIVRHRENKLRRRFCVFHQGTIVIVISMDYQHTTNVLRKITSFTNTKRSFRPCCVNISGFQELICLLHLTMTFNGLQLFTNYTFVCPRPHLRTHLHTHVYVTCTCPVRFWMSWKRELIDLCVDFDVHSIKLKYRFKYCGKRLIALVEHFC